VVGDESAESLKESMKGWVEMDGSGSSLVYHKKQSLLNSNVRPPGIVVSRVAMYS